MSRFLESRFRRRLDAEVGSVRKSGPGIGLRIALAYPNRYYIGMSNVGFQGVYKFWNGLPGVSCERVFLPDPEELREYRRTGSPLLSLETSTPVGSFDALAFSITFEPDELNLVRMLELAHLPPLAKDRGDMHPLVLAGGPVTFLNPEPMAPFLDVIAIGEAEALLEPLTAALRSGAPKTEVLDALDAEPGFYVPSFYRLAYGEDGTLVRREHRSGGESKLVRAKMGKRSDLPPPATYVLTPSTEMSNKFLVEVSRGCPTLCRFCWAGYNYLPKRSFEVERILEAARTARPYTGDIGLVSTAVGAHREIEALLEELRAMEYRVSVSSLRFEDLRSELLAPLAASGERTLAVAPEVGTDRLRFAIHKRIRNEEILEKTDLIFSNGIENLKLYLMVGLPTEEEEDLDGLIDLVDRIRKIHLAHGRARGRLGRLIPSINPFIPKPGTPFQWHSMEETSELQRRMRVLERAFGRMPNVDAHFKSPRLEKLQALLALGDRRLAPVLIRMARGESDLRRALAEEGLDLSFYIHRRRPKHELLPWALVDNGMKESLLVDQYDKALLAALPAPALG